MIILKNMCHILLVNFALHSQDWYLLTNKLEIFKCEHSIIDVNNVLHCTQCPHFRISPTK